MASALIVIGVSAWYPDNFFISLIIRCVENKTIMRIKEEPISFSSTLMLKGFPFITESVSPWNEQDCRCLLWLVSRKNILLISVYIRDTKWRSCCSETRLIHVAGMTYNHHKNHHLAVSFSPCWNFTVFRWWESLK